MMWPFKTRRDTERLLEQARQAAEVETISAQIRRIAIEIAEAKPKKNGHDPNFVPTLGNTKS